MRVLRIALHLVFNGGNEVEDSRRNITLCLPAVRLPVVYAFVISKNYHLRMRQENYFQQS